MKNYITFWAFYFIIDKNFLLHTVHNTILGKQIIWDKRFTYKHDFYMCHMCLRWYLSEYFQYHKFNSYTKKKRKTHFLVSWYWILECDIIDIWKRYELTMWHVTHWKTYHDWVNVSNRCRSITSTFCLRNIIVCSTVIWEPAIYRT